MTRVKSVDNLLRRFEFRLRPTLENALVATQDDPAAK